MKLFSKSKEPCTCNLHLDYQSCCDTFKEFLNDCKVGLKYEKDERRFSILIARDMGSQAINNCPWCGFKLPPCLFERREEILLNEYGLDDPFSNEQKDKVPAEFLTDEWWKRRGL